MGVIALRLDALAAAEVADVDLAEADEAVVERHVPMLGDPPADAELQAPDEIVAGRRILEYRASAREGLEAGVADVVDPAEADADIGLP